MANYITKKEIRKQLKDIQTLHDCMGLVTDKGDTKDVICFEMAERMEILMHRCLYRAKVLNHRVDEKFLEDYLEEIESVADYENKELLESYGYIKGVVSICDTVIKVCSLNVKAKRRD